MQRNNQWQLITSPMQLEKGQLIRVDYPWTPEPLSFAARYDKSKSSSVVQSAAEIAHECAKKYNNTFQSTFSQTTPEVLGEGLIERLTDKKAS